MVITFLRRAMDTRARPEHTCPVTEAVPPCAFRTLGCLLKSVGTNQALPDTQCHRTSAAIWPVGQRRLTNSTPG